MATSPGSDLLGRARELASRLSPLQKVVLGVVVATAVAGGLVLSRTADPAADMTALFTDLSAADASSVVDELTSRGVAYELTDAGRTVLVPRRDVYDLRVDLAGQGLPADNEGYALLDDQGITASEFRQRIDYQRALEGELARTVTALDGVRSATVHLALPEESVFVDEIGEPTASVLVTGMTSGSITDDEVQAIVHLVSSSVKGMRPSGVTVVDSNGMVLSAAGATSATGSSRAKVEAEVEQTLATRLTAMLSRTTGPNRVAVTVNASVDLDERQQTIENWEAPDPGAAGTDALVTAERTTSEQYGTQAAADGTGVLDPEAQVDVVGDTTTDATDYSREDVERTYALDRTVEQVVRVPGSITSLDVAVIVDEAAVDEAQLAALEQIVATAAGVDPDRGDTVTITRLPFDTSAQDLAETLAAEAAAAEQRSELMGIVRTGVIVFVILVALLLAQRSARQARRAARQPYGSVEVTMGPRPALAPAVPGVAPAGDAYVTQVFDAAPRQEPSLLAASAAARQPSVEDELVAIARERPQEIANVLRAWLTETKGRR